MLSIIYSTTTSPHRIGQFDLKTNILTLLPFVLVCGAADPPLKFTEHHAEPGQKRPEPCEAIGIVQLYRIGSTVESIIACPRETGVFEPT